MAPQIRQPCVCYFEDDEEEWARLPPPPMGGVRPDTGDGCADGGGSNQQMSAPVPDPAPLDDWPQWPNDVRAYYPDGKGRFYEMYFVIFLVGGFRHGAGAGVHSDGAIPGEG